VADQGDFDLQTAVYTALTGSAEITAIGGVYSYVPEGTNLPYVTIGENDIEWDGTMGVDWFRVAVTVHSWAYGETKSVVKALMDGVFNALHKQALTISGKTHVSTLLEFSQVLTEDDGVHHGVQRFGVIMHEPF
jgi:hypothetical protein